METAEGAPRYSPERSSGETPKGASPEREAERSHELSREKLHERQAERSHELSREKLHERQAGAERDPESATERTPLTARKIGRRFSVPCAAYLPLVLLSISFVCGVVSISNNEWFRYNSTVLDDITLEYTGLWKVCNATTPESCRAYNQVEEGKDTVYSTRVGCRVTMSLGLCWILIAIYCLVDNNYRAVAFVPACVASIFCLIVLLMLNNQHDLAKQTIPFVSGLLPSFYIALAAFIAATVCAVVVLFVLGVAKSRQTS